MIRAADSSHTPFGATGWALLAVGFWVWAVFSFLPGVAHHEAPFRIREAWDSGAFWTVGAPVMALAQAFGGGGVSRIRLWQQPLWMLGGLFAGALVVHPAGNGAGLLPLALVLIGAPAYVLLLAVAQAHAFGNHLRLRAYVVLD